MSYPDLVFTQGRLEVDLGQRELRALGGRVPLGRRAFEVLEILVGSAGRLVTREELMRRVWPGAVAEENTLEAHVSAVRRALGPNRELLRTTYGRGYTLLGIWETRQGRTPTLPTTISSAQAGASTPRNNLPLAASELIGRAGILELVRSLMGARRVVTLTGTGGIGKTRLALEIAHSWAANFSGDIWLVELASVSDPRLVPSAVAAAALLVSGKDEISASSVARLLADRRFLLVLDNCEHVIDAAASLVEAIARSCPLALILATSREALCTDAEHVVRVQPLDLPPLHPKEMSNASGSSAVRLFVARMLAVDAGHLPSEEDMSSICAICRRLDGIPLAIELAAGRTQALDLKQILSRLDDRFSLLTRGRRTVAPRHQALRATLDWSYELLSEAEQHDLRFVAIFAGGFTLDAAVHVLGNPARSFSSVLDGISGLVAKSLLSVDGSNPAGRWRMLETVRAYALDRLAEQDETQHAARLHASYYCRHVANEQGDRSLVPYAERLSELARDLDNVRATIKWSFSPKGEVTLGIALTAAYVPVWLHLSLLRECRKRAELALDRLEAEPAMDTGYARQLRLELGLALFHTAGFTEKAGTALTKVVAHAERLDDTASQVRALWAMWTYQLSNGQHQAAQMLVNRFSRAARRSGDAADLLVADRLMGNTLHYRGEQPRARHHLQRFVNLYSAPANQRHLRWFQLDQRLLAHATLARVLWLQGCLAEAKQHAQASLDGARVVSDRLAICYALGTAVCPISLMCGDLSSAEQGLAALRDVGQDGVFWRSWGSCLEGSLLIRSGEPAAGVSLIEKGLAASDKGVRYPEFLGNLAEGLARIGRFSEALASVDRAITQSHRGGQHWCLAELIRIRGDVMLRGSHATAEAEACFVRAGDIAHRQGATFFQLRAALSLARLQMAQGRVGEARLVLAPVCERFTTDSEAVDVCAARTLLGGLLAT